MRTVGFPYQKQNGRKKRNKIFSAPQYFTLRGH